MNTTYANNQKGNGQKGFSGTPPATPVHTQSQQNQGGYTPPTIPVSQPPTTTGKNILLWVAVIAVILVFVVFMQRNKTDSVTEDTTATTTETTNGSGVDTETTLSETTGGAATGITQGITKIIVSRHPDLTTDVQVLAGGTVLRNFTVVLEERSNITPVLMYIKKNMNTTLSYDGILDLVVFQDVSINVK